MPEESKERGGIGRVSEGPAGIFFFFSRAVGISPLGPRGVARVARDGDGNGGAMTPRHRRQSRERRVPRSCEAENARLRRPRDPTVATMGG